MIIKEELIICWVGLKALCRACLPIVIIIILLLMCLSSISCGFAYTADNWGLTLGFPIKYETETKTIESKLLPEIDFSAVGT